MPPPHARGRRYAQLGASGVAHKLALLATDEDAAAAHARAQRAAGTRRLPLLRLLRDVDAPRAHNLSAAAAAAAARGVAYDGWAASAKLLDERMVAAARGTPLVVWVVDDEEALRRAWRLGASTIVTNRPLWARARLRDWHAQACGSWTAHGA